MISNRTMGVWGSGAVYDSACLAGMTRYGYEEKVLTLYYPVFSEDALKFLEDVKHQGFAGKHGTTVLPWWLNLIDAPLHVVTITWDLSKTSALEIFIHHTLARYVYEQPKNISLYFEIRKKFPNKPKWMGLLLCGAGAPNGHSLTEAYPKQFKRSLREVLSMARKLPPRCKEKNYHYTYPRITPLFWSDVGLGDAFFYDVWSKINLVIKKGK